MATILGSFRRSAKTALSCKVVFCVLLCRVNFLAKRERKSQQTTKKEGV